MAHETAQDFGKEDTSVNRQVLYGCATFRVTQNGHLISKTSFNAENGEMEEG